MVLHLMVKEAKIPFSATYYPQDDALFYFLKSSWPYLACRKILFLQKDDISAERLSFGSFCISAERNTFGRLSFCFLQKGKISLTIHH